MGRKKLALAPNVQPITGEQLPTDEEAAIRNEIATRRERAEREAKCDQALQQVLDEHNCNVLTLFKAGEQFIPTNQIVVLPVMVKSVSK